MIENFAPDFNNNYEFLLLSCFNSTLQENESIGPYNIGTEVAFNAVKTSSLCIDLMVCNHFYSELFYYLKQYH
jgi:hypothetical protein